MRKSAVQPSVLLARGFDGACAVWPIARNVHRDGILFTSTVPATIDPQLDAQARDHARRIAERMGYVGVLCIEFFVLTDGSLCVNEMAPRPHNSGHWTIDASITSQFEQQARVLAGLPLGDTGMLSPAIMLNLLGDLWYESETAVAAREPDWARVLAKFPRAKLHLYGKAEPRRARKMGHLTLLASDLDAARVEIAGVAGLLGLRV